MKKIAFLLLLSMTLAAVFAAPGADRSGATKKPKDKDTLVIAAPADVRSMDPHATNDQPSSRVWKQIYNCLMYQDPELKIANGLAKSYKVVNDTTYEFELIPNVKFHNGETLKASDVKYTFERMAEKKAPGLFLFSALDRVEVTGDYTFRMILKYPFGPFLTHLAHPTAAIINEKAVKAAGDNYSRMPVGTGPYRMVEWKSADSITLQRFDDFYGEKGKSARIIFRVITENPQRAIALETGEVDIGYDIDATDFYSLKNNPEVVTYQSKGLSTCYMGFNVQKKPFNDVRVRQAINYAVDTAQAIKVIWQGAATVPKSPIAANVLYARTDLPGYSHDLAKAKQLLAAAGYPNGFKTSIWTNDNPVRIRYAEIFQEQLRQVGIDVSIEIVEWSAFLTRTAAGEHDMFILGWTAVTGDADYGLYSLFHSSQFGEAGNRTFYANPQVDSLLDKGRTATDPNVRKQTYFDVQKLIMDDAPWVFVYVQDNLNVTRAWNKGFRPNVAGHHELFASYNE